MATPNQSLEIFQQIYSREFGRNISDDVARDKAMKLLSLYKIVFAMPDVYSLHINNNHIDHNDRR